MTGGKTLFQRQTAKKSGALSLAPADSDQIDDSNVKKGYGEVWRIAQALASPYLDPFRVKLVSADNPLAVAAREINERFPGRLATRMGGHNLDGVSIDDVYIYPHEPCAMTK